MNFSKCYFLLSALCLSTNAYALDIQVTKFNDTFDGQCDSDCSLREAITLANSTPGLDRIFLNEGRYFVTIPSEYDEEKEEVIPDDNNRNNDLDILDDIIIEGSSTGVTVIDSGGFGPLIKNISGTSTLVKLTLTNAWTGDIGGAIYNLANLTLRYCIVTNNRAAGSFTRGSGGGIANTGTLTIYSSEISNNHSNAGEGWRGQGGGILNTGKLTIRDTTIRGNSTSDDDDSGSGGGIFNSGKADIRRTLFLQNRIAYFGSGAAILNTGGGTLKLYSSTVSDHVAGEYGSGAVANGGVYNYGPGTLYLTNVTITDNEYFGLYTKGHTVVKNSIISGNASSSGGLAQNCYRDGGLLEVESTLIGAEDYPSCFGDIYLANNKTFITLLEPLANNGGTTLTHALRNGSLGIDAATTPCPGFDQTGKPALLDGNDDGIAKCDLGAVEYQP